MKDCEELSGSRRMVDWQLFMRRAAQPDLTSTAIRIFADALLHQLLESLELEVLAVLKCELMKARQSGNYDLAFWLAELDSAFDELRLEDARIIHEAMMRETGVAITIVSGPGWLDSKAALMPANAVVGRRP